MIRCFLMIILQGTDGKIKDVLLGNGSTITLTHDGGNSYTFAVLSVSTLFSLGL